jgi:glycosyltransferase involved in cell wall biosynthesis
MATYNGGKFLKEQVCSILEQLSQTDELIISDDKSTDNTIEIITSINDERIHVFINEGEHGYTKNFENAIRHSTGECIFLSDQDDVWIAGKVQRVLEKLKSAELVVTNAEIVDAELNLLHPSHFDQNNVKTGFWINFLKTRYIGACMAFRKEILAKLLPFPKNQTLCAHDYWIALIGEAYYNVALEETPLLKYRRHAQNASSGVGISNRSFIRKIRVRIYSFFHLISRWRK